MLKGIPPVISPELMSVLMKMGHGDEIVMADGHFPADSHAQRIVRSDGHSVLKLLEAVMTFLPLDSFVEKPAAVMQPIITKDQEPPIWKDFRRLLESGEGAKVELEEVERFAFYERARNAYAIVATGETAVYANLILKKGIIVPE